MQTITFYSYKGGVGRTLTIANVAWYLASLGQKVFLVDFDLEAPGLHYKLSLGENNHHKQIKLGVLDYVYSFAIEGKIPDLLAPYVVPVDPGSTISGSITLMPAGRIPCTDYWRRLAKINWHELFYSDQAQGIPFFLEFKERIRRDYAPDFLLVDSRTGVTEIGGVATSLWPDCLVCFLLKNLENLEGARAVMRSIQSLERLPSQRPVEILPVLTRIPKMDNSSREKGIVKEVQEFLNEDADELVQTLNVPEVFVLHSDPELQIEETLSIIGFKNNLDKSPLLQDYLRLFNRLIPPEVLHPYAQLVKGTEILKEQESDSKYHVSFRCLVGPSLAIKKVRDQIDSLRYSNFTILIQGEPGTGKEVVARTIDYEQHYKLPLELRRDKIIPIDCSKISDELLNSQFLGHEEQFIKARGGTLFLHGIGEMYLSSQERLLDWIYRWNIDREYLKLSIRIIAATHSDLEKYMRAKNVNAIFIKVPPLRERTIDFPWLIRELLENIRSEKERIGNKLIIQLSPDVYNNLLHHNWPYNLWELEQLIRHLVDKRLENLQEKNSNVLRLFIDHIPNYLNTDKNQSTNLEEQIDEISKTLKDSKGDMIAAAKALGLRTDPYEKLEPIVDLLEKEDYRGALNRLGINEFDKIKNQEFSIENILLALLATKGLQDEENFTALREIFERYLREEQLKWEDKLSKLSNYYNYSFERPKRIVEGLNFGEPIANSFNDFKKYILSGFASLPCNTQLN